jgi:agmatinase
MFAALDTRRNFLAIPKENSALTSSRIVILPAPYEATVSYGGGTGRGPAAILDASHYVELFDEETKREIYREHGIATLKPLAFGKKRDAAALQLINDRVRKLLDLDKFVVTLGGEHTISAAPIAAYARKYADLSVLQFDAHSDLREEYEGTPYSHACVMARVAEFIDPTRIVQVGIRAQCREEAEFIREHGIHTFYAHDIRSGAYSRLLKTWDDAVVERLTDHVYITFDVDGLDPSIMPATGTPEPNGLLWHETLHCIRKVSRKKKIVGFDVVELAPLPGLSHPDLTTAKLVSKILNYAV